MPTFQEEITVLLPWSAFRFCNPVKFLPYPGEIVCCRADGKQWFPIRQVFPQESHVFFMAAADMDGNVSEGDGEADALVKVLFFNRFQIQSPPYQRAQIPAVPSGGVHQAL